MKRGQNAAELSPNKAEKKPKFITGTLSDLPDDELKLVLGYLDHESKGNLKLTSKDNEKRVMQLDPSMRDWKLYFREDNWETLGMSLSRARIRHTEDGSIHDIKISLGFFKFRTQKLFYSIMFFMDSIVTHWKNNIVSFGIGLSGYEIFLLDKTLFMPKLKQLVFEHSDNTWSPMESIDGKDASKIVSLLIENHAETLEHLELLGSFDITLTKSLQIKRFNAVNMSPQMVVSVLKSSQSSLEVWKWQKGEYGVSVDMETETYFKREVKSLSLKLKVLDVTDINARLVSSVINSSHKTLEHLEFNAEKVILDAVDFNLEHPLLMLDTFSALDVETPIVVSVLQSSHSALRNLTWSWTHEDIDGSGAIPNKLELKLECFHADNISLGLITSVIQSTKKTLKDLTLWNIRKDESFHLDQLQLERFEGDIIDIHCAEEVIKSCQASLKDLILNKIDVSQYANSLEGFMTNTELQINSLSLANIPMDFVIAFLRASQTTLDQLELEQIYTSIIQLNINQSYDIKSVLDPKKSGIKTLYVKQDCGVLVAELLKYAHLSLEELSLDTIENAEFDIGSVNLSLKRFYGVNISLGLLTSVMQHSQTPYKLLSLEKIFASTKEDYGARIEIDPSQLKSLMKFQFQNPVCVLEI